MNNTIKQLIDISKEGVKQYLPEVNEEMLEENGKLYYMNDIEGTLFDWGMNERLCELMTFYNNSGMGAIKINVLSSGLINVYVYKDRAKSSFISFQKRITTEEALELVVLMYNIADKNNLFGKAVNDMNSDIQLTKEHYSEFNSKFEL